MGMSCNSLSPDKHIERMRLYNLGYKDSEIGAMLGLSSRTIADWRYKNGLPKIQYCAIDSWEDIQECLHCKRKKCTNCKHNAKK